LNIGVTRMPSVRIEMGQAVSASPLEDGLAIGPWKPLRPRQEAVQTAPQSNLTFISVRYALAENSAEPERVSTFSR
jgi:hypothetical protein